MPEAMTAEAPDRYRVVDTRFGPSVDPAGKIDVACYMTTDGVDEDGEVILPAGVDLGRFEKNGPLMVSHDWQKSVSYYPLPVGQVEWVKRRPNGLLGGIKFARGTDMGRQVKALVEENILRGVSVGVRVLEQSPMTRAEADGRPDWKAAFARLKGRVNVIRRCKLLELSVVPIPCNEDALIETLRVKGITRPEWIPAPLTKTKEVPVADTEADDPTGVGTDETEDRTEPVTPDAPAGVTPAPEAAKALSEPDEPDGDEGETDEGEDDGPVRKGHFVKCVKGAYKGMCGKVKSVHRSGLVPDVDDDVMGTKAEPAVRMQCYKSMRDGHVETEHHVACKAAHCERTDDLKPPKRAKAYVAPAREKALEVEILPGEVRTDAEVLAEKVAAARAAATSPEAMRAMANAVVERLQGVV